MNENTPISLSVMMQNSRSRDYGHGIVQWEVQIQVGKENPGNVVAMVYMGGFGGTDATQSAVEATAIRIVDSYNALSGLNPGAITDIVRALEAVLEVYEGGECWHDHNGLCQAHNLRRNKKGDPECQVALVRAAIAKMKGE